jgi:hypothetical protein
VPYVVHVPSDAGSRFFSQKICAVTTEVRSDRGRNEAEYEEKYDVS